MSIADNYQKLLTEVEALAPGDPPDVVVVSKTRTVAEIKEAYDAGARHFGENRVQELLAKMSECPDDIRWHLIGTLQKNKASKVANQLELIHSVDSVDLAEKLGQSRCLLQVNLGHKHGFSPDELFNSYPQLIELPCQIQGLMTMGPYSETPDAVWEEQCREVFKTLRLFRDELQEEYGHLLPHLSMGMSGDFPIAIEEGATLIRVGSSIFGSR